MKILFGTAYSEHSVHYFEYIQQLALGLSASITVVHIYERPILLSEEREDYDDVPYPEQIRLKDDTVHREELSKIRSFIKKNTIPHLQHLEINHIVKAGDTNSALLDVLNQGEYQLFVLGMRKHNIRERLLGNIVYRLIDQISTPLLLIPPNVRIRSVKNIIYTTAFEVGEEYAADMIIGWCRKLNAHLTLTHVVLEEKNITTARRKLYQLRELFTKEADEGILTARLLHGEIKTALEEYINRSNTDMVVMHRRKKGMLETMLSRSVIKDLTEDLVVPLLVLKGGYVA